jgi:hypothetical protein
VSDGAIADLVSRYPFLHQKTLLHCSGALSIPGVAGAHPLMTFGHELYTLGQYQKIPFMVDQGHDFAALLPGLCNPHFPVRLEDKPRYHALCVMAGNFSQILWQAASSGFEGMGLPPETLAPYLQQVVCNFIANPGAALTGPLSRGDMNTIRRNLNALNGDPLQPVYQALDLHRDSQAAEGPAGSGAVNILKLPERKRRLDKLVMVTCYDYTSARIIEQSEVDMILVGDSAAMVMHGHPNTLPIGIDMMAWHVASVRKGAPHKFIVADLPFLSYRKSLSETMDAVGKVMQAGAEAVKLEGIAGNAETIAHIVQSGVPVMGHIGLTPQSVNQLGGSAAAQGTSVQLRPAPARQRDARHHTGMYRNIGG